VYNRACNVIANIRGILVKIDLHVHAKERSACARDGEEEMIQAAIVHGLDGLIFTDHNRLIARERVEELNFKYAPFRVFGGIEVSVQDESEHVLVLGVHDPALESGRWTYPDLFAFVRERGGYLALAHPFRFHDRIDFDIDRYPPDAVEVHSKNIGACDGPQIRALVERLNLWPLCNSDAHRGEHVGIYYNRLARTPRDEGELLQILKAGDYVCHGMEERIAAVNREVEEREALIRRLIAEGRDGAYYRRITGNWVGHYDRVAMGRSYRI
jgi:predicted metal-dependent phosphoesterase TrpH